MGKDQGLEAKKRAARIPVESKNFRPGLVGGVHIQAERGVRRYSEGLK